MFGDIVKLTNQTFLIEGKEPVTVLIEPDIASSVVHKSGEVVYIMDTGATTYFKNQILKAVEWLRPFEKIILMNSHGHPDHTPNNDLLRDVECAVKQHYISEKGFPSLDYDAYFKNNIRQMMEYYYLEDGPGFPFSILMSPLKIVRLIKPEIIERSVLNLIYKRVISKFEPLSPSRETAIPFENRQRQTLTLGTVTLTGWNFDNDIFVVESRGHTTDSVSFYLPKDKVLFLSDETIIFFNIWSDSNSENIVNILRKSVRLYEQGFVDVLVGGHEQKPLRGREIVEFLETRLEDHEVFNNELDAALKGCTRGATVKKLYQKLKRRKHLPAIKKHFDFEFPKMPPMLKSNITNALLEKGLVAEGEKGKKVFKYPL